MGKESIPAQFFKAIFIVEEEYGLEPPLPPRTDYPQKYSEMSADVPNWLFPPCWQKAILPTAA